jgi:hypothetical protein
MAPVVPGGLWLVEIKQIQDHLNFTIPGKVFYSGKFSGVADGRTLIGEFHFNNGRIQEVSFPGPLQRRG